MKNTETYLSFKKYDIFIQSWLADQPSKTHLLILHGLGEHSSCYSHMASYLCDNNISCHSFDFIGHGQSSGQRGYTPNFDLFVDQFQFVYEKLTKQHESSNILLFCHSMGGLVGLKALLNNLIEDAKPIIFSNPLVNINVEIPQWKRSLAQGLSQFLPRLSLDNEIDDNDLTKDPEMIASYSSDPLRHRKISSKLFMELQESTDVVRAQLHSINNPTLFLLSPNDRVCDADATQTLTKEFKNSQLELFPQSGHEIVNDLSKNKAFDDILAFIKETN